MDDRERQYREYLALRQQDQEKEIERDLYSDSSTGYQRDRKYGEYFGANVNKHRPEHVSIEQTPYGSSELRRRQQEKERRDREMKEYLAARDADRRRRGVRAGLSSASGEERARRFENRRGREEGRDEGFGGDEGLRRGASRRADKRHRREEERKIERADFVRERGSKKDKKSKIAKNTAYNKADRAADKARARYDKKRAKALQKKNRKKYGRGRLKFSVSALSLGVIGVGALFVVFIIMLLGIAGSVKNIPVDENAIGIDPAVASQLEGYKNIAILGIDARANEDDSNARSDAIIVASINEETNEIKMFSVFRDTYLDIGEEGYDKITHAYYFGGAQQSLFALNENLDLNIEDVVVINWKTVADTIDSVDGIDIDVQESEIAEMNKYIPNTAKNVDGPDTLIEAPGKQTLNGVQAVTYSRIRKDAATGDYRRNERMKIVFAETFKKVKGSGFIKMFSVAKNIAPEIRTDMSTADMVGLLIKFKSYDMTNDSVGFPYEVGSWTGRGAAGVAWFGPPKNLANNVSRLHEEFFGQAAYVPTDTVQNISNEISYRTGIY